MTLLLTNTCQVAVLVAIEEGLFCIVLRLRMSIDRSIDRSIRLTRGTEIGHDFIPYPDRDLFIHCRLHLPLPEPVDDLIPPTTLISTQPIPCSTTPVWRTTLAYFLSTKILKGLRRRKTQVTLEIFTLSMNGDKEELGRVSLPINLAKMVRMNSLEREELTMIKDYVVNKGRWHRLSKGNAEIKAGLFFATMPTVDIVQSKSMAKLQRTPLDGITASQLGLELCSVSTSPYLTKSTGTSPSLRSIYCRTKAKDQRTAGTVSDFIQVGTGTDQYTFVLRILGTRALDAFERPCQTIEKAYFRCQGFGRSINYAARLTETGDWEGPHAFCKIALRGKKEELETVIDEDQQIVITLFLQLKGHSTSPWTDISEERTVLGTTSIRMNSLFSADIHRVAYPIRDERYKIRVKDFMIACLLLEVGLEEGWDEQDTAEGEGMDDLFKRNENKRTFV
ncbi:uncharacterized protein BYT42DRAFT_623212 [Radiomyces spectabilis]|uniref:uncharacterized protein n=1 Tax=Radiomyces spectabilis TaxID=64574 RepID=UPI0022206A19|nr:uncharacterized protein BYT42DRAFT_623212 [Radiomyces spectabilis]KAI8370395.1 hypothetical protein BYT42DRAFT_623212 [Radiomyces spectabilis]